jgi:hypothetical protein
MLVIAIPKYSSASFYQKAAKMYSKGNCLHVENQTGYKGEKAGPVRPMNTVA